MKIESPPGPLSAPVPDATVLTIPRRDRAHGPLVARRLRAAGLVYACVVVLGMLPVALGAAPRWRALGLGLVLPGAGFLYTGDPALTALTLVAFFLALVAWFGSGNLVAPPLVWLGAAVGAFALAGGGTWAWAQWAVPATLAGLVLIGAVGERASVRAARRRAVTRNEYLARTSPVPLPDAPEVVESSPEDLAAMRGVLDRALQPLDSFTGYDRLDQFQTAATRYQLNFQQYALALGQRTRTPAFRGYLSQAQRNLIEKMTDPRVWGYWRWENLWGNLDANPDPMRRDNIMLSGYLGLMIGAYEANTDDRRYSDDGALEFRLSARHRYPYDFHRISEAVHANFVRSPFGMFPCEPNWIYSACNTFGVNTLLLHDRLHHTEYAADVLDRFRRSIDEEFLTLDGRITAIRSSRLGLTIPMLTSSMADAGMILFLHAAMPEYSQRTWAIFRREFVTIVDGAPQISLRGWDKIDVGNYRRSDVSAHALTMAAAREMGDDELYATVKAAADAKFAPSLTDGVRWYERASTQANAMLLISRLGAPGAFRDLVLSEPRGARGPHVSDVPYPDVLVARAVTDGAGLEVVLRPGRHGGRFGVILGGLAPGATYDVRGCSSGSVDADEDGRATIEVELDDRHDLQVVPAA
jgi:hypothetical protein